MGILTSPRPPRISFFSLIALLYSQILVLMVIPGVVVFHYAWRYDHHSQGLYVAVGLSPMLKNLMCGESWTVRIDSRENWYLNSTKTSRPLRGSRQHVWAEAVMVRFVWEYGECEQAAVTS
jgi:hypothetical protein